MEEWICSKGKIEICIEVSLKIIYSKDNGDRYLIVSIVITERWLS